MNGGVVVVAVVVAVAVVVPKNESFCLFFAIKLFVHVHTQRAALHMLNCAGAVLWARGCTFERPFSALSPSRLFA